MTKKDEPPRRGEFRRDVSVDELSRQLYFADNEPHVRDFAREEIEEIMDMARAHQGLPRLEGAERESIIYQMNQDYDGPFRGGREQFALNAIRGPQKFAVSFLSKQQMDRFDRALKRRFRPVPKARWRRWLQRLKFWK